MSSFRPFLSTLCRSPSWVRLLSGRSLRRIGLLSGSLALAGLGAVGVDWQLARHPDGGPVIPRPPFDLSQAGSRKFMNPELLKVGARAPALRLQMVDGPDSIEVADDHGGKPLVLLFGSYGCNVFCNQLGELERLHQSYHDRAVFAFVYVKEAEHWGLAPLPGESVHDRIKRGQQHFHLTMPCYVPANAEQLEAYNPFPLRLIVVDPDGRIAMDGGRGFQQNWHDSLRDWLHDHTSDATLQ